MYRIELINKKTKQVIKYDDVVDLNDGEKMFFKFQINTKQLDDGEYTLNLYDDDTLIKTDTLNVGDFNAKALQYKRGEDIYVETKIDVQLTNKFVELNEINSTIYPDDGIDGMLSVTVDATPLYNKSKAEGIEIGYADGKQDGIDEGYATGREDGIEEQKSKLSSINITENDTYINEDGYNEITVNVQPNLQEKYVNVTDNNTTVTADEEFDGMKSVEINATPIYNNGYNVGKSDGVEEQKEKLSTITINGNGKYTNEDGYNEVIVDVKAQGGAFDFNVIGYDDEQTNEVNQQINKDIAYSESVLANWKVGAYADLRNMYGLVYCPQIDTSKQKNFSGFFQNCYSLRNIAKLSTVNSSNNYEGMFSGCYSLKKLNNAELDTSNGTDFENFCYNCQNLTEFNLDLSKGTIFKSAFGYCNSLQSFNLDVSQGTVFESMFTKCSNLKTVSNFNTSNATSLKYCFNECGSLISVNDLNVPVATDLSYTFNNCKSLVSPPKFLNCVATKFEHCFDGCSKLESVELFNTENATSFYYMFNNCSKLKTIPNFSTSKVANFGYCLNQTVSLESLPLIDMSSATNITGFFGYTTMQKLTQLGGFKNLKISWTNNALNVCPNLTKESVMNVINNLYDFRGNGDSTTTKSLKLGATNMAKLTDDEKAIATAKGWVLTS